MACRSVLVIYLSPQSLVSVATESLRLRLLIHNKRLQPDGNPFNRFIMIRLYPKEAIELP